MDPIAVISDVHGNLTALTAVLDDIDRRGVRQIVCLGDVVGYGPEPASCLDLVLERCQVTLMGNHDFAVLYEPSNFNIGAEMACYWTRRMLEREPNKAARDRRWKFLLSLPVRQILPSEKCPVGEVSLAHGSPRRPVNEYVFPDDIYNSPSKLHGLFERFGQLCVVGHTHVPGVFLSTPDFYSPEELGDVYEVDSHQAMINVGSVGQPRDRDPRACYVLLEEGLVRFVRVEYDVEATVSLVHGIEELDDYLGNRLREGR